MSYEISTINRGTASEFIMERKYLKNVTPATIAWYEASFKSFQGCENRPDYVKRIAELRERGVSAISVNTWLRAVNAYLNWKGADFKLPKLKEEQKILATLKPEMVSVLLWMSTSSLGLNLRRAHLVALTILDTGVRAQEVLSLMREDCDLENMILKVKGKGGKYRVIPFSVELRKHIFRLISNKSGNFIYGTKHNTRVSVRNLERDFKALRKKLGITGVRFSPHILRHSFAVQYLRNGGNLEYLRR